MYLWRVTHLIRDAGNDGSYEKTRLILTSKSRAEDADYRARQISDSGNEVLKCINILGYLPSIVETTSLSRPKVYYVVASYLLPKDPQESENSRRVLTEYYSRIDPSIGEILGVGDHIGPIATGPEEALDVAMIGLIIGVVDGSIRQAKEVIHSHIFAGIVPIEDIMILRMCAVEM